MNSEQKTTASAINPALYPGVDLSELSSRKGNEGNPRYVLAKDGNSLGDTNTGRCVFPISLQSKQASDRQRATRMSMFRDQREVVYGNGK